MEIIDSLIMETVSQDQYWWQQHSLGPMSGAGISITSHFMHAPSPLATVR